MSFNNKKISVAQQEAADIIIVDTEDGRFCIIKNINGERHFTDIIGVISEMRNNAPASIVWARPCQL